MHMYKSMKSNLNIFPLLNKASLHVFYKKKNMKYNNWWGQVFYINMTFWIWARDCNSCLSLQSFLFTLSLGTRAILHTNDHTYWWLRGRLHGNSSAYALELPPSYTKPSIYNVHLNIQPNLNKYTRIRQRWNLRRPVQKLMVPQGHPGINPIMVESPCPGHNYSRVLVLIRNAI